MNLPDVYTRLVAKRPELAVVNPRDGLGKVTLQYDNDGGWLWIKEDRTYEWCPWLCEVEAMILRHWIECLPEGTMMAVDDDGFRIYAPNGSSFRHFGDTPLAAVAAFWEAQ